MPKELNTAHQPPSIIQFYSKTSGFKTCLPEIFAVNVKPFAIPPVLSIRKKEYDLSHDTSYYYSALDPS